MSLRHLLALVLITASSVLPAKDKADPVMTSEEKNQATAVAALGKLIFEHDRAAALATDELSSIGLRSDKRVRGWVTEPTDHGITVTVVGLTEGSTPAALYSVKTDQSGTPIGSPIKNPEPIALTDTQMALYQARSNALKSTFEPCSKSYNTVALATDSGISVYLLPGTTDSNVVPIGGTYKVDYDQKGEKLLETRGYTKSCIALQKDEKSVGMMITHLLDSFPTEVHVYWSLWANSPMYVGIVQNKNLWAVSEGNLRLVVRGK